MKRDSVRADLCRMSMLAVVLMLTVVLLLCGVQFIDVLPWCKFLCRSRQQARSQAIFRNEQPEKDR